MLRTLAAAALAATPALAQTFRYDVEHEDNSLLFTVDVNGDAIEDVITAQVMPIGLFTSFDIHVSALDGATGALLYRGPDLNIPDAGRDSGVLGDVNGDGVPDLLVFGTHMDGATGVPLPPPSSDPVTTGGNSGVLPDITGDGLADYWLRFGTPYSVNLFSLVDGAPIATIAGLSPSTHIVGPGNEVWLVETGAPWRRVSVVAPHDAVSGPPGLPFLYPYSRAARNIGDLDGDGFEDLLVIVPDAGGPPGASDLGLVSGATLDWLVPPTPCGAFVGAVGCGDMNGDGAGDIAITCSPLPNPQPPLNTMRFEIRSGVDLGVLESFETLSGDPWLVPMGAADLDGDGRNEVLVADWQFNRPTPPSRLMAYSGPVGSGPLGMYACWNTGAVLRAEGTSLADGGTLSLSVSDLPPHQFGIFACSRSCAEIPAAGVLRQLCLRGTVGRFVGPGQVLDSGAAGSVALDVSKDLLPSGSGTAAVMAGDTWYFQFWHRDSVAPGYAYSTVREIRFAP